MREITASDIRSTDLGATPPSTWLEKWICCIIGAQTFHWFKFIMPRQKGWIISESIAKGTALNFCYYPVVHVYRIKGLADTPDLPLRLLDIHAEYGDLPYDWQSLFKTAIWWLFKHYLGIVLPWVKDKPVNCQEWSVLYACELGVKLIPDNEPPMCTNLENSPYLEYVGVYRRS